jgi:hypothetical protein
MGITYTLVRYDHCRAQDAGDRHIDFPFSCHYLAQGALMNEQRTKKSDGSNDPPQDPDIFRVSLRAPDRAALARVVRELGLDIDHQHPGEEHNVKEVLITAFLTQLQIDELKGRRWELRVEENLSAIGRERQKEVGKGDRFESGKVRPTGLGKKIRGAK